MDQARSLVIKSLESLGKDGKKYKYKTLGISGLSKKDQITANAFLDELALIGIFVVPVGELEMWLPNLGIEAQGKGRWIVEAFEKLGSDPTSDQYVQAADDDVWTFLEKIATWINDPKRQGMPA